MAVSGLSVGELEAQYPLLCKAMRVLRTQELASI